MIITIFLTSGETFQYNNVSDVKVKDRKLFFKYHGISTNRETDAVFYLENLAGYGMTPKE